MMKMELFEALMKWVGIVAMLVGTVFTAAGAYTVAGGTGITFVLGEIVLRGQEGGQIFSIIGTVLLLGGLAMIYVGFKFSRLLLLTIVLGLCSLIIPTIPFGMGNNLVAVIVFLVLSYSWIAMTYTELKFSLSALLAIVLGLSFLIIPIIPALLGHNLVTGIVLIVLSYSWITSVFLWLSKG